MHSCKKIIYLLTAVFTLCSCSASRHRVTVSPTMSDLAQSYVDKYGEMAVHEMKRTGIPASITLAQGMLESDFGRSSLARDANNHFGIKCHNNWNGAKVYHDDETRNECFRSYKSAEESFRDHSDYLTTTPRYKQLFSLSSTDYKGWAHGLKKTGYATNPQYAYLLIDNIEKYNLHTFDTNAGRRTHTAASKLQANGKTSVNTGSNSDSVNSVGSYDNKSSYNTTGGIVINAGQGRIKELNRIQYVIVRDGDTYESLAEEFQMLKWEIAKYNEIPEGAQLTPGQILFLQPKRNKAEAGNDSCIFKQGDTMYLISQRYGIKLSALYEMNAMEQGTEPAPGKKINLR
jgi:flagellum-specific peptidoglycan hydrolase FlgJ